MQYSLLLTALCASAALAIKVTQPDNTTTWGDAEEVVVQWTSVNTDPTKFDVYLVNNVVNPPIKNLLANNIQTSAGSYDSPGLNAPPGQGYQINLVSSDSNNVGILAQSNMFTIKHSNSPNSSSSSASASASSSTAASASSASSVAANASSLSTATASQSGASSTATSDSTSTSATTTGSPASTSSAASTVSPKPASGNMNAVSLVGLGVGGILALLL